MCLCYDRTVTMFTVTQISATSPGMIVITAAARKDHDSAYAEHFRPLADAARLSVTGSAWQLPPVLRLRLAQQAYSTLAT